MEVREEGMEVQEETVSNGVKRQCSPTDNGLNAMHLNPFMT